MMNKGYALEVANYINADILLNNLHNTIANKGSPISAGSYKYMLSTLGKEIKSKYENFTRVLESDQAVLGDNLRRVPQIELFTARDKNIQDKEVLIMKVGHKVVDQLTIPYEKNPVDNQEKCFKNVQLVQSFHQENIIQPERVIPESDGHATYLVFSEADMQLSLVDAILDGMLNNEQRKYVFFQLVCALNELHKAGLVHQTLHRFCVDPHVIVVGNGCKVGLIDLTGVTGYTKDDSVYSWMPTPRRRSEGGVSSPKSADHRNASIFESPKSPRAPTSPRTPRRSLGNMSSTLNFSPLKTYSRDYVFASKNERIFRDVTGGDNSGQVNNIWTLGTIFAFLLRGIPIFKGSTSSEVWESIINLFGRPTSSDWCSQQRNVKAFVDQLIQDKGFDVSQDRHLDYVFGACTKDEIDLLRGMLCINQEKRLTAEQILQHPYFDEFRQFIPTGSLLNNFSQSVEDENECESALVVAGCNFNHQTGMQHCQLHPTLGFLDDINSVFETVPSIQKVCCTSSTSMLLSKEGRVFILGGPQSACLTELDLDSVVDIDCNGNEDECHYLMLKSDGKLYVYGSNSHGQLALGHTNPITLISAAKWEEVETPISKIAAGGKHTIAIHEGELYACGSNVHKQCGIDDHREVIPLLTKVATFSDEVLKDVKCGDHHTIILTHSGRVFTCGDNRFGQCGFERVKRVCVPSELPSMLFNRYPVAQIAAGANHSLFVTSQFFLYCVGQASKGQLGIKTEEQAVFLPSKINFQPQTNDYEIHPFCRREIMQAFAKFDHSFFVTNDNRIFVCGDNSYQELVSWPYQQGFYFFNEIPKFVDVPVEIMNISCPNFDNTKLQMDVQSASFGEHHLFVCMQKKCVE
ncbi:hypothetical protein C9374_002938 [Naegleria lovaniensis]|uniref:Protein kinase domain-containing protein n=1 Tax=Naegleria lovaniensis TaxID=51637 RepID=A0AA88GU34_NAELO|nr:uncharacterized protein C9374_002938 [Naegleria lovaniensis]KAG2385789.1 hypothetical protein C9374_002938 [Naegleria lovaniensis]